MKGQFKVSGFVNRFKENKLIVFFYLKMVFCFFSYLCVIMKPWC